MERRNFLRLFGGGVVAIATAPILLSEEAIPIQEELPESTTTCSVSTGYGVSGYIDTPWEGDIWREWYDKYGKDFSMTEFMEASRRIAK